MEEKVKIVRTVDFEELMERAQQATAFHRVFGRNQDAGNPTVQVTKPNITILLTSSGGGTVTAGQLSGPSGTFTLSAGPHTIQTGSYTLYVIGVIANNGSVEFTLIYN